MLGPLTEIMDAKQNLISRIGNALNADADNKNMAGRC
jgi:hypothetical protein